MERVERIRRHPLYLEHMAVIGQSERERIFCRHGIEHALDVARIMYIIALEKGIDLSKDVIYGTALLHDIGRGKQYEEQIPHHEAGAKLAEQILAECGYEPEERQNMTEAIRQHHKREDANAPVLSALLYAADKKSRPCYQCPAGELCYWAMEKRNGTITY